MKQDILLGLDIGGTKSSAILATRDGEILDRESGPTEVEEGPRATIARLVSDAKKMLTRTSISHDQVLGIGISCGGPLDPKTGIVYSPPNLPGWDAVPIVQIVSDALHLPAVLENDADCCALAELYFGAGRGKENVQIADPVHARLMKRAKEILDPDGKLNPGEFALENA
jgi:glucokinase